MSGLTKLSAVRSACGRSIKPMISSLILLSIAALGIMAALALFLSLKWEFRSQTKKNRARMDEFQARLQTATQRTVVEPESPAPMRLRSGMNISKRVQALRLLRRGEDISHVAAALGVPRREVELLIRVQKLSAQRAAGAGRS